MTNVAIAGGTGGLGHTIVESLFTTTPHKIFILSRSPPPINPTSNPTHLQINYTSPSTIAEILKTHNITTIISTLRINTPEDADSQLNLIKGADISGTVKRFAPSEFGIDYLEAERRGFPFPSTELKTAAIRALKSTSLIYARIISGTFLDYLFPSARTPSHLTPRIALFLDFQNRKAVIPGTGEDKVAFTHSRDVAAFVTELVGREEWREKEVLAGVRVGLGEIVGIAEGVAGDKFDIKYVTEEVLKGGEIPELEYNVQRYETVPKGMVDGIFRAWGQAVIGGWFDFGDEEGGGEDEKPEWKGTEIKSFFERG